MNINKQVNLKVKKISHREKLVNILDTFQNHDSVQKIKLPNFDSKRTVIFSKVT